jgi:hypothetical protein
MMRFDVRSQALAVALTLTTLGGSARPAEAFADDLPAVPVTLGNLPEPSVQTLPGVVKIPGTGLLEVFYRCDHRSPRPIVDVNPNVYASAFSTNPASGDAIAARFAYDDPRVRGLNRQHLDIRLSGVAYSPDFSVIHAAALHLFRDRMNRPSAHILAEVNTSFNCARNSPHRVRPRY